MSNPHDILSDRAHRIRMRTNVPSSSSSNNTTNHHQSTSSSSSSSSSVVYPSSNATNFFGFQLSTSPKSTFANNNNTNPSSTSTQNQNQLRIRLIAERAAIRQRVRRDLAKQQNAIRRQREFSERTRVWNEDILPNWNELIYSNKVKELCYKGIPPNIRGKVWPLLIGNDLEIDEKLFEALTNKAHSLFGHKMTAAKSKLVLSNSQGNDSNMPIASYESNSYPDSMEDEFFLHNKDNFSSSSKSISHTTASFSHNMITKPVSLTGFERSDTIIHDRQFAMDDRSISHDIPIPKQSSSLIDITDEPWFENERDGSLDQEAFHMIQRQLFLHNPTIPPPSTAPIAPINSNTKPTTGAPAPSPGSYLMKKIKDTNLAFDPANVPHSDSTSSKTNNEEVSSSLGSNHSFNLPSTGISHDTAFPFDLDYSNDDHESPRNRPRVSSPIKSQPLSRNGSFAQMKPMTPHDIRDPPTGSMKQISETPPDSHILDISSDHVTTPPRRTKHSPDYLIDAGLIVDNQNLEIPSQAMILQRIPSGIATPSKRRTMSNASKYSDQQDKPTKGHFAPNVFGNQEGGGDKRFGENMIAFLPLDSEQPRFSVKQVDRKRLLSSDLASQLANLTLDEINEQSKLEKELNDSQHTNESEDPEMVKLTNVISLIEWDLPRTFPTLAFFHDGGMMHTGLERVLYCFALFRSDIGYVQGMSFLVATLLLYMDEYEAFKCLSNLLSRRIYTDFYGLKKKAIDSYVMCFDYYFKKLLPLLYNHFRNEDVTSEMFLMDWNLSLFTKALPLEVAAHVWDIYLFEGEMFILCVGLGILKLYAPILSTFSVEKISPFLLHLPENIKSEELFASINQINISKKHYEKIRRRMIEEVYGSQNVPSSSDPSNHQPSTTSTTATSGIGAFKAVRNSIKQSLFTFLPSGHHYSSEPNLQAMINEEISSSNHSGSSIQDQLTPPRSTLASNNTQTSSTNVSPEHSLPQKQQSHDQTLSPQTSPSQAHSLPDTSHPTPSHHKSHHAHNNHNHTNSHHLPPSHHHHSTHKSTSTPTTSTASTTSNNTANTISTSSKHKSTSKKSSGDCLPS